MNLADIMKKATAMQSAMADMQAQLENVLVTGQAGGGVVKVTMSGKFTVKAIEIDPSILKADEKEMVEDLLLTALADAKAKAETVAAEQMKSLTAGLPLPPGMKLPF
jgi:DNA-binding YbaB/EbfC family protein